MITPSIGRVVLVHRHGESLRPEPALITFVWNDRMINVGGFEHNGQPFAITSLRLLQDDDVAMGGCYAEWMPYQKGQAAKTEQVESAYAAMQAGQVIATMASKDDSYRAMVNHFLGWKLPADFGPDAGISFKPAECQTHDSPLWPSGTNLLHAGQALEMFKHCVQLPDCSVETKQYPDGTTATGVIPLPDQSPAEQSASVGKAPHITMDDIEANISSESYFTAADGVMGASKRDHSLLDEYVTYPGSPLSMLTFCILILKNGTKIVGVNYGPVYAENFNADDGRKYARENAIEQIWPLMGYELRSKLAKETS